MGKVNIPKEDKQPTGPSSNNDKKRSMPLCLIWQSVLGILLAACLLGIAYLAQQYHKINSSRLSQQKTVSQQIEQLQQQQQSFENITTDINSRLDIQQLQLQQAQKHIQQLLMKKSQPQQNWVLEEVRYQLRLATLNLRYQHNISAALHLLQTSDQQLQQTQNPRFDNLRQHIQSDIATLKAVPKIDTMGLLAQLTALSEQVTQLPLKTTPKTQDTSEATPATSPTSTWKQGLQSSWQALQKIIVIRRKDQVTPMMLHPEQQQALKQNLQLLLQQAQWAILQNKALLYGKSLNQAIVWVRRYFDKQSPITQNLLTSLAALTKVNIQPSLPELSSSQHMPLHPHISKESPSS